MTAGTNGETVRMQDRGRARRQAFLDAARTVFLDQGYEAASVNDVVRMAGGSMATLYAQFGSKEGLFLEVVLDQHERFTKAMLPAAVDHLPLDEGLQAMGEHFVRALLARDNLAFYRIVVGEGRKFPEHLQRHIATGAENVRKVIADFLRARKAGVSDPEQAAAFLVETWRARHHYRALADEKYVLSERDLKRHVAAATDAVLNGTRPRA